MELVQPSAPTLKKYGLDLAGWEVLADFQGRVCAVCKKLPKSGRLCIDHLHIKGWAKLPPEERRKYVRGLVCFQDNHALLRRGMTPERLRSAAAYLEAYARRSGEVARTWAAGSSEASLCPS